MDEQKEIREEFIQFPTLVRVTGEAIAAQICKDLSSLDLDVKKVLWVKDTMGLLI